MIAQIAQASHAKPWKGPDRAHRRLRPHHPRWRQRQRVVSETDRKVLHASVHEAPTAPRHRFARERMKRVVDCLFTRQNPGAMSLSRQARAKPIFASAWLRRS